MNESAATPEQLDSLVAALRWHVRAVPPATVAQATNQNLSLFQNSSLLDDFSRIAEHVTDVNATLKNVNLDSISCNRVDIAVAPLICELAFSAFFRTDEHG